METDAIIALVRDNLVTSIAAAATVVLLIMHGVAVSGRRLLAPWRRPLSATERRFRNVFWTIGKERREEIVAKYQRDFRCGRIAAMQHALDQRDREVRAWR